MLAELRIKLAVKGQPVTYHQSSNFHGVMMKCIDSSYAEKLHEQGMRPYTQYIYPGQEPEWVIRTMTQEAYANIILPLMEQNFQDIVLHRQHTELKVLGKQLDVHSRRELQELCWQEAASKYLELAFITPTAFKSQGEYINMPSVRLLWQSIFNRYNTFARESEQCAPEILEQLVERSRISGYNLRTISFTLEKIRVSAFVGKLRLQIKAESELLKVAKYLALQGEYGGIGIKTAIGMGAYEVSF